MRHDYAAPLPLRQLRRCYRPCPHTLRHHRARQQRIPSSYGHHRPAISQLAGQLRRLSSTDHRTPVTRGPDGNHPGTTRNDHQAPSRRHRRLQPLRRLSRCQNAKAGYCPNTHHEFGGRHPVSKICGHCVLRGEHEDDADDLDDYVDRMGQADGTSPAGSHPQLNHTAGDSAMNPDPS